MTGRTILWDFEGTLVHRPGLWGSALLAALDAHEPGHTVTRDDLRPGLRDGFPWHRAEIPHPELDAPERWWEELGGLLRRTFASVGYDGAQGRALANETRRIFVDPDTHEVFEDTVAALERLSARGWRHLILSNHVPELPEIVAGLGLAEHFDAVLTSATLGYEKPHPAAFEAAIEAAGRPDVLWMVGDNPEADVRGAERLGIPAVLVRTRTGSRTRTRTAASREGPEGDGVRHRCDDLEALVAFLQTHA